MDFNYNNYIKSIHRYGKIMLSIGVILLVSAPFVIAYITDSHIIWDGFFKAIVKVLIIYLPSSIVEFLIYAPMIGIGGCYLVFLTGNITNLKLPCVFNAREIAKTESGTPEDEIITTLSVATSALVTMLVIFVGVLLLIPLTPILQSPTLQPAFANVVAALFGALSMQYFTKNYLISSSALILMVVLCIVFPFLIRQTGTMLIPIGGISIGLSYFLFKKGKLDYDKI